jgi:hypothetical protein
MENIQSKLLQMTTGFMQRESTLLATVEKVKFQTDLQ